jgi:hypothetical protein
VKLRRHVMVPGHGERDLDLGSISRNRFGRNLQIKPNFVYFRFVIF